MPLPCQKEKNRIDRIMRGASHTVPIVSAGLALGMELCSSVRVGLVLRCASNMEAGMRGSRLEGLQRIVEGAPANTLRSARGRKAFAHRLAVELGLWEPPVQEFVGEMAGLNFFIAEDRKLFVQFAELGL